MNPLPAPHSRSGQVGRVLAVLTLTGAILVVLGWVWTCYCSYPSQHWNALRLAPSFMLRHGVAPYPGPNAGPLTTWIYGPMPILLQLPATFATNTVSALLLAAALNIMIGLVPLWLAVRIEAGTAAPTTVAWAFLLAVAAWPATNFIFCQADNAAVAFGLLGCLCLHGRATSTPLRLWAGALAAALAVWSKQTEIAPALGQIAFLLLQRGSRAAATHTIRCLVAGALLGLVFLPLFGAEGLIYNMFVLPGRLPMLNLLSKAALPMYLGYVIAYVILPVALVLGRARELGHRDNPFQLYALTFLFSLPFNLAGFAGIGGTVNSLHGAFYLLPAGAVWLARRSTLNAFRVPMGALLALATLLILQARPQWPLALRPKIEGLRQGMALAGQMPGQIYFPWNPLLTYYTDGRFYHVEDGLSTREAIGSMPSQDLLRRYLPPSLCVVAYDRYRVNGPVLRFIPADARQQQFGEWILFSWTPPGLPAGQP